MGTVEPALGNPALDADSSDAGDTVFEVDSEAMATNFGQVSNADAVKSDPSTNTSESVTQLVDATKDSPTTTKLNASDSDEDYQYSLQFPAQAHVRSTKRLRNFTRCCFSRRFRYEQLLSRNQALIMAYWKPIEFGTQFTIGRGDAIQEEAEVLRKKVTRGL
ncbi:MAG: hypothetical protein MZW92_02835 [Comamonadaceae bacterium]|nr:hypothetical protein [Comamonadaceae bacterium]